MQLFEIGQSDQTYPAFGPQLFSLRVLIKGHHPRRIRTVAPLALSTLLSCLLAFSYLDYTKTILR